MKIAVFTASFAPILNGVAFAAQRRARWLLERGHQVLLFHPRIDGQYPPEVHCRPMVGLDELQQFAGFSSFAYPSRPHILSRTYAEPRSHRVWNETPHLDRFQPDLVLVEDLSGFVGFGSCFLGGYRRPVGVEYARRAGIPAVALFHTDWLSYSESYLGRWFPFVMKPVIAAIARRLHGAYDATYFPTRTLWARYSALGVAPSEVVPFHGISCRDNHPGNIGFDPLPHDPRPTLLFVGRMGPEKNPLQLLAALPEIRRQVPDVHLIIVGKGPLDRKVARAAAPNGTAVTLWGEAFGDELKGLYAAADLLVNPSVTEVCCTTNLEAMASGTPVVAAAEGGNIDQIIHDRNGLLVRPNDPAELGRQIGALLSDRPRLQRLSIQAREMALADDFDICGERLERKFHALVNRTTPADWNVAELSVDEVAVECCPTP